MAYGLYNKGKGGTIKKIKGNPRNEKNQKNLIVWGSKNQVTNWIKTWGKKTQKNKWTK